eukprot:4520716-Pyramimonas_sp.AAC.1
MSNGLQQKLDPALIIAPRVGSRAGPSSKRIQPVLDPTPTGFYDNPDAAFMQLYQNPPRAGSSCHGNCRPLVWMGVLNSPPSSDWRRGLPVTADRALDDDTINAVLGPASGNAMFPASR